MFNPVFKMYYNYRGLRLGVLLARERLKLEAVVALVWLPVVKDIGLDVLGDAGGERITPEVDRLKHVGLVTRDRHEVASAYRALVGHRGNHGAPPRAIGGPPWPSSETKALLLFNVAK